MLIVRQETMVSGVQISKYLPRNNTDYHHSGVILCDFLKSQKPVTFILNLLSSACKWSSLLSFPVLNLIHIPPVLSSPFLHFPCFWRGGIFLLFCTHHLPSLLPVTPLVIMDVSCYDMVELVLFLSPLRQVLDVHQLFVCMRMCVRDRQSGTCATCVLVARLHTSFV